MATTMSAGSLTRTAFGKAVRSARPQRAQARGVRVYAAADRPMWMPGNPAPAYLDGSLAGDFGFDPLRLGSDPEALRWFVQAELIHCRVAMMGAAGMLFPSVLHTAGSDIPEWFVAGEVSMQQSGIPLPALIFAQVLMSQFVELKRLEDWKNPGSQADGQFFGITDDFKGVGNGYPGGKYFDFMGFSRGDAAKFDKYKWNEIRNGRLAMVACLGMFAQYFATGKGPVQNLVDHIADPTGVTFATNGVSLPFAN